MRPELRAVADIRAEGAACGVSSHIRSGTATRRLAVLVFDRLVVLLSSFWAG